MLCHGYGTLLTVVDTKHGHETVTVNVQQKKQCIKITGIMSDFIRFGIRKMQNLVFGNGELRFVLNTIHFF
jgi:hypothetical protein